MNKDLKKQKGFTLIETILYIGIFVLVFSSIMGVVWNTLDIGSRVKVSSEVVQNGRLALERISQKIRTSDGVVAASSVFGSNPGKLVLDFPVEDVTIDTYEKNVDVGNMNVGVTKLRMKVGENAELDLTSDKVDVETFIVEDFSGSSATDNVNFTFVLNYVNPGGDPDMDKALTINSGVTTRK